LSCTDRSSTPICARRKAVSDNNETHWRWDSHAVVVKMA
jgi:hypothetical protein